MASITPTEAETLIAYYTGTRFVNYIGVSAAALLLYDYCLTLKLEIKYIWLSPLSLGKALFFLPRYIAFADIVIYLCQQLVGYSDTAHCTAIFAATSWMFHTSLSLASVVLAARTWAIWGGTRIWSVTLVMIFTSVAISGAVSLHFFLNSLVREATPPGLPSGCLIVSASNTLYVPYTCVLVYDGFIFLVTAIRGIQHSRQGTEGKRSISGVLYRDALLFSGGSFCVSTINLTMITCLPAYEFNAMVAPHVVCSLIFSCRIILHLREAAQKEEGSIATEMQMGTWARIPENDQMHPGT